MATEFVDGETLRQHLKRSKPDLPTVLNLTTQVASALAAAHRAGIVHRDIKPENIMLRPDGYVKVLDFGLAKLTEQHEASPKSRLATNVNISSGLVMGTVKYMSPEQAQGLSVDPRSDIFSLGVVLYEMLTGNTPFKGEATGEMINSILTETPISLSQSVPELPIEFEYVVTKALAKNPGERYQSMDDVVAALEDLRRKLEIERTLIGIQYTDATTDVARTTAHSQWTTKTSITRQVVSLVAQHKAEASVTFLSVVLVVSGIIYSSSTRRHNNAAFQDAKMSQLVETDRSRFVAISPDGTHLAHTIVDANGQSLLLRPVATNRNTVLVPPTNAQFSGVTFSRDGNTVYYVMWGKDDSTSTLYQANVSGGDSRKVLSNVASPITFSPDGHRFAFVREIGDEETGLFVVNTDGTDERLLSKRRSPSVISSAGPSWSPDGRLIATAILDVPANKLPQFMNVIGVDVNDGTEKLLANGEWLKILQVAWLSDNQGFIMAATQKGESALLWHVSYPDGNSRRISNEPSTYPRDYTSISLSADSKVLAASRFEQRTNLWTAASGDPSQIKQITFGGNHRYQRLAWTPSGQIVFPSDASGDRDIWIMEGDGSGQRQLTAGGRFNQLPTVSPDGRYIVYTSGSSSGEDRHIWRMNLDGNDPIQLTHGANDFGPHCSPDSQWVVYMSVAKGKTTIWKVSINGGEAQQLTKEVANFPVSSPDGDLIACWWWPSGSPAKIALIPSSGGKPVRLLDPAPDAASAVLPLRWTADGQALVYCVTRAGVSNLWRQPIVGGPPFQLTDFKSETIQGFDWSRENKLLLSRGFTAREIVLIQDLSR